MSNIYHIPVKDQIKFLNAPIVHDIWMKVDDTSLSGAAPGNKYEDAKGYLDLPGVEFVDLIIGSEPWSTIATLLSTIGESFFMQWLYFPVTGDLACWLCKRRCNYETDKGKCWNCGQSLETKP